MVRTINYPKLSTDERASFIKDLIRLYESGLERLSSPNDERRSKQELDINGKVVTTIEKEQKWHSRIERCKDIRNRILPALKDIHSILTDLNFHTHQLSTNIEVIQHIESLFNEFMNDKSSKPEDVILIKEQSMPQLLDVLYTLDLYMYGD